MGNQTKTAEEGIIELSKKESLIRKYLNYSSYVINFMGNKCRTVEIPGSEVKHNCRFYLYNIEGFFDIENGLFSSIKNLLYLVALYEEKKINIKTYSELKEKSEKIIEYLVKIEEVVSSAKNLWDNIQEYIRNSKQKDKNKDIITRENKIAEDEKIIIRTILESNDTNKKSKINEIFSDLCNYIKDQGPKVFKNPAIYKELINIIRNHNAALKFLEEIIPFKELKEYVSSILLGIKGLIGIGQGIFHGIQCYNAFMGKDIFGGIINLLQGGINLASGIKDVNDARIEAQTNYYTKNYTTAQKNLNKLLNLIDEKFKELIKDDLDELYKNNMVILAIGEEEGVDFQYINIKDVDNFAKPLDHKDIDRVNFIKNMILFFNALTPEISQLKGEKDVNIKEAYGFLIFLKKKIIRDYNNKYSWIKLNYEKIEKLIKDCKDDYDSFLQKFNDNGEEKSLKNFENKLHKNLGKLKNKSRREDNNKYIYHRNKEDNQHKKYSTKTTDQNDNKSHADNYEFINYHQNKNNTIIKEEKLNKRSFYRKREQNIYTNRPYSSKNIINKDPNEKINNKNDYSSKTRIVSSNNRYTVIYGRRNETNKKKISSKNINDYEAAPQADLSFKKKNK